MRSFNRREMVAVFKDSDTATDKTQNSAARRQYDIDRDDLYKNFTALPGLSILVNGRYNGRHTPVPSLALGASLVLAGHDFLETILSYPHPDTQWDVVSCSLRLGNYVHDSPWRGIHTVGVDIIAQKYKSIPENCISEFNSPPRAAQ